MLIILLIKIPNLGDIGDQVNVKPGYARNFLLPNKKALLATRENIKFFNACCAEIESQRLKELEIAIKRKEQLSKFSVFTISAKSNHLGKLFGSIGINDIIKYFNSLGLKINKNEIKLPNGLLHNIGQHEVLIKFHPDIITKIIINIISNKS
ncbi:MAG: 50S ribosomal protein L9 [Candidatus Dasytiphilus stammeri]